VRHVYALALAGVLTAAIAGCGSSSKNSASTTTTTAASTSATTAATPAASTSAQGPYGATSKSAAASGTAVIVTTKHSKLGTILAAGPKHKTVYLFEADKGPSSSCTGACEHAWPPLTAASVTAGAGAQQAHISTITRPDGVKQVTYNGHPLYFFARDGDAGDAYGQGVKAFGASWYVLTPAGQKIDTD
jgi:predicted lipoprotein with Yx(FWY)xxD motif